MVADLQSKIEILRSYSACDVSDALLKLQKVEQGDVPYAGFLSDLTGHIDEQPKIIAPASTLLLVPKDDDSIPSPNAVPAGSHWVDMTEEGTVVVIEQPPSQICAAIGGIMAARMKLLGVKGVVVSGRVRDLAELRASNLPVWARAKSTVATGGEAKVKARNVPVSIQGVTVSPGDIVFCDPLEGVVVIPRDLLDEVLSLVPRLVQADDRVKEEVEKGMSVFDAFKNFRVLFDPAAPR